MTINNTSGSAINADESLTAAANLVQAGDFAQAIEILTPIISAVPTRAALRLLAQAYHGLDEHEEAATIRDLSMRIEASKPPQNSSHLRVLPSAG